MKKAFILIFVICFSTAAFTQAKPRLAILPITGGTGGDGETIAELFSFDPEINRVFVPIPRTSSIEAIMREQQFQSSTGLTDSDTIARLGRQSNADYVVAGHIQVLGNSHLVLITIIHVESLQQIAGDYRQYANIEEIQEMIPDMARRIARAAQIDRTGLPRLAVLPFSISTSGVNQNDAEVLAQILATEVANSGRYVVLPRTSLIQSVLMEQEIQRSGRTEQESIKAIGEALNAQYVLSGNVRSLGQNNIFTALILETERGEQVKGDFENYNTVADGLTHIATLSRKLIGDTIATDAVQNTRQPSASASDDDWRNKWFYLGGGIGYGGFSYTGSQYNYISNDYDEKEIWGNLFVFGVVSEFALLPFLSFEIDLALGIGDGVIVPVIPVLVKLGYRFPKVELFLDVGYTIGAGFSFGGTFGVKAGPGILFAKVLAVPFAVPLSDDYLLDSVYVGFLGYKFGIGGNRR